MALFGDPLFELKDRNTLKGHRKPDGILFHRHLSGLMNISGPAILRWKLDACALIFWRVVKDDKKAAPATPHQPGSHLVRGDRRFYHLGNDGAH